MSDGPTESHGPLRPSDREGAGPTPTSRDQTRRRRVWVATRLPEPRGRSSPHVRFDVLQIVAWAIGLTFVVLGLVAVARAGFADLGLFDPVVEVAGLPTTPLLALLWLLVGVLLLAAATGEVDERGLRITGVVLVVIGIVWTIEPGAFEPYLGISTRSGASLLVKGAALTGASFVPPLAARRPGM